MSLFSAATAWPLEDGSGVVLPRGPVSWHLPLPGEVAWYWPAWAAKAGPAPTPSVRASEASPTANLRLSDMSFSFFGLPVGTASNRTSFGATTASGCSAAHPGRSMATVDEAEDAHVGSPEDLGGDVGSDGVRHGVDDPKRSTTGMSY